MGRPKALVRDAAGRPWLHHAVGVLRAGGCEEVLVVLGARADEARLLVPDGARVVVAADWATGLSASLRTGLAALTTASAPAATPVDAALVLLVDLPDLVPGVVGRLLPEAGAASLARAAYAGRPGHPVLIGRDHWPGVLGVAVGDEGARPYLRAHAGDVRLVECGDLATGVDQDVPGPSGG